MKVKLQADFPLDDAVCKEATGKTVEEWLSELEARTDLHGKRREAIQWLYDAAGRGKDVWWATTLWVEWERRKGILKKDGLAEGFNICVTKTLNVPVDKAYAAFFGEQMESWYGGAKPGPDASFTDADGNVATATRIRENKDLRYRWKTAGSSHETDVDVTFADKGGKTALALMHNRIQTREESDGLRNAWSEAFAKLKTQLEK